MWFNIQISLAKKFVINAVIRTDYRITRL